MVENGSNSMLALLLAVAVVPCLSFRAVAIRVPEPKGTFPTAVNKRGEVAGYCLDSVEVAHGFVRDANGHVTVFDVPEVRGTFVSDINNTGVIVGYYVDARRIHYGFVRDVKGRFTTLDAPSAGTEMGPPVMGHPEFRSGQGTFATGVNDAGAIAGYFIDAENLNHGFIWDKGRGFTTFDVEGSGGTEPQSISSSGYVIGTYQKDLPDARTHFYRFGDEHGFLRTPDGTITVFDSPGSGAAQPQRVKKFGLVGGPHGAEEVTACHLNRRDLAALALRDPMVVDRDRFRGARCSEISAGTVVGDYYEDTFSDRRGFIRKGRLIVTKFDVSCEDRATAITSVTSLIAGVTDSVTIKGRHFGNYRSLPDSHAPHIVISDGAPGRRCVEGVSFDDVREVALRVVRWSDTEITLTGFTWPSRGQCPFHPGDEVKIGVWNAETDAGPASFDLKVGSTSKDLPAAHHLSDTSVPASGPDLYY